MVERLLLFWLTELDSFIVHYGVVAAVGEKKFTTRQGSAPINRRRARTCTHALNSVDNERCSDALSRITPSFVELKKKKKIFLDKKNEIKIEAY